MNITNRDIEIFKLITNYGMLSTKHINSICFNSIATTTVLRRLRMLEHKKFIQRLLGLESQDVLWILLPKGAKAASVQVPHFTVIWRKYSSTLLAESVKSQGFSGRT